MSSPTPPPAAPSPDPSGATGAVPAARATHRRWRLGLGIAAVVVLVVLLLGTVIRLPYVIYSPGDATPVEKVVKISGAKTYEHAGQILFLTVSVSNERPNVWRLVQAELDDDSQVIGEKDYLGTQSRSRVEKENVQAMDESQLFAKIVALGKLGYHVTATGSGALVQQVVKGSPAAGRLEAGDVITAIDGQPVRLSDEVGTIVRAQPVGTSFAFTFTRGGATRTTSITTAAAPSGDLVGKPYVGIAVSTKDLKADFPVQVSIDPGPVSGPSAGLAFTLTIIDELSPGNLTGGKQVAVTGTIDPDGHVGEVGGVRQKTAAAISAGAKLFLVPRAEVKMARSRAGDHLRVVGVDTIDDALRALHARGGAPVEQVAPAA